MNINVSLQCWRDNDCPSQENAHYGALSSGISKIQEAPWAIIHVGDK